MAGTLTFLGGTGTVTGSRFLLRHGDGRYLVDCGLYQGERQWRRRNWEPFVPPAETIDHVVLTHAHLDHSGYLPALVRQGFSGPISCSAGTAALAEIVLRDSAHLQEEDAQAAREQGWSRHDPPLPLYDAADAERAIALFRPHPYGERGALGADVGFTLSRAGHILGSSSILLDVGDSRLLFSGDLGRPTHPVLLPRDDPPAATTVVVESTYGDRTHSAPRGERHEVLADAVRRTLQRGGSVVVPAFAIDRTELVLHELARLMRVGAIPAVPVYVDSPMALASLAAYRRPDLRPELRPDVGDDFFDLPGVQAARSVEESMRLNQPRHPCIIVSASGMATGGRVVHHLRYLLPDRRNTVVLTGYQAVGTRGRALQDGARQLKMHGRYVPVRAEVVMDEEFSVHADAGELVTWLQRLPSAPETVYVVHGEPEASRGLARRVQAETGWCVVVPEVGEKVRIG
ncbi:MBL fold metallo-hydrolase RNA specificity domain-containing protein [Angustibacter sp. Root456]|uniref:MBL fold metallo-hydrolase RNA specificity domain-containing protein n=1 Tax=Angustibacter sp. Root456 TaxID=1736539 RepID=UPI0006FE7BF3|nr:MBL fold metallo-hydrolase [Angustibacter sp. Root456]KQX62739.1 MBL fold metallo-hydrolase [Angustibacter sp. Root456]